MRLNSASILGERAYRIFLYGAVSAGHKKCPMVGRDESEVFIKYKRGNVHRQSIDFNAYGRYNYHKGINDIDRYFQWQAVKTSFRML